MVLYFMPPKGHLSFRKFVVIAAFCQFELAALRRFSLVPSLCYQRQDCCACHHSFWSVQVDSEHREAQAIQAIAMTLNACLLQTASS